MKPRLPNTTVNEARIFKMVNDVDTLKVNTERQLEGKFTEIDGVLTETKDVVKEAKSTLTETKSKLKQIDNNFENLSNEVVDVIKEIKATGLKGDRGDDGYTPVKGKDYFDGKTPEIDENKIAEKVIKLIPENKPSLKIIQESIDIDKVVEEVNKKLDEKPFEINKINGLSGRLDNITRDIARKTGYSGGGDTVAAGTGITITTNNAGSKVISAAGGGTGTVTQVDTAGLISGGPITTTGTITTSMATNKLVGRSTAGTGVMEEITLGTGLAFTGTTLNVTGGSGSPGGSTTQLQYNNAGTFGGISGATTDGTVVTYTANNLKAADITASGSGGFLIQSNSGTDVGLFGAGGGAGATFYGGVNISGELTVDTNTLYVDATNNRVGVGTASPSYKLSVVGSAGTTAVTDTGDTLRFNQTSYIYTSAGSLFFQPAATTIANFTSTGVTLGGSATPTHTLTLPSTSTGIALYNTADQTTNYERFLARWSSNIFYLDTVSAGSGTNRSMSIRNTATTGAVAEILLNRAGTSHLTASSSVSSTGETTLRVIPAMTGTSTIPVGFAVAPTINQSTTAGYTALLVNPTETTIGNGTKLLADFQVGGSSKAVITNTGSLGIGTTAPSIPLDVISTSSGGRAQGIGLRNASTADNTEIALKFSNTTVTTVTDASGTGEISVIRVNTPNAGDTNMAFKTTTSGVLTTRMTLNASGLTVPQVINTPATITVTANTGTVTRANRINNFTNSSAATMTITMSTTGAADGDSVIVRIKDFSAAAQTITWVNTENSNVTAPTTSNGSTTLPLTVGFMYNSATSKWRCIASA